MYVQIEPSKTICGECGSEKIARTLSDHRLICLACGHEEEKSVTTTNANSESVVYIGAQPDEKIF